MIERIISVKVEGKSYSYRATFEVDEDGRYVAECPAIEGCYTEGRTIDEAVEMMKDALILSIESRLEIGEAVSEEK